MRISSASEPTLEGLSDRISFSLVHRHCTEEHRTVILKGREWALAIILGFPTMEPGTVSKRGAAIKQRQRAAKSPKVGVGRSCRIPKSAFDGKATGPP